MIKAELRTIYLNKRRTLSVEARETNSLLIADRFFERFHLDAAQTLHCFIPIEKFGEIDTTPIFTKIWNEFPWIRTSAPRLDRATNELRHHIYRSESKLLENVWGIREPANEEPVDTSEIDLVIVPLLCFDERGYRVGYGKGFYDRFLAKCRPDCLRVGLSFFPQVDRIDNIDSYDIPLNYCVMPDAVYSAPK